MKKCKFCGQEFISTGRQLYCSIRCRDKFWYKKHRKRYQQYNKEYYQKNRDYFRQHWQKYYQEHREFLIEKSRKYQQEHPDRWKKNNNQATRRYKDKIRFSGKRKEILERDNYTCQICGKSPVNTIHHLDKTGYYNSDNPNNNPNNLITLCRSCHSKLHWKDRRQGDPRQVSTPSL